MTPAAATVKEYLAALPADRRKALEGLRKVVRANIDKAFEEGMQYGMPSWYLPHSKYPAGYHCDPKQPLPFASIASQKNHIALYLFGLYCSEEEQERFRKEWTADGRKLDMGKSCIRVKKLEDVPLDVLGRAFKRQTARKFVAAYEGSLSGTAAGRKAAARRNTAKKKVARKKDGAAKATRKKAARKKTTRKAARRG